jgi:hypothetical protein
MYLGTKKKSTDSSVTAALLRWFQSSYHPMRKSSPKRNPWSLLCCASQSVTPLIGSQLSMLCPLNLFELHVSSLYSVLRSPSHEPEESRYLACLTATYTLPYKDYLGYLRISRCMSRDLLHLCLLYGMDTTLHMLYMPYINVFNGVRCTIYALRFCGGVTSGFIPCMCYLQDLRIYKPPQGPCSQGEFWFCAVSATALREVAWVNDYPW